MRSAELMGDAIVEIVASIAFLVAGYSLWAGIAEGNYLLLVFGSLSVIAGVVLAAYAVYYGIKALLPSSWKKEGEQIPRIVTLAGLVLVISFLAEIAGLIHHHCF